MQNVCIFGQGFVGLPLALSFAIKGCHTLGVDIDEKIVNDINAGITSLNEELEGKTIHEILKSQLYEGRYKAELDGERAVRECSNIIVTVGMPINEHGISMKPLEKACRTIGKSLKKEDIVLIRSTLIPGTTEEFILPVLERESKMKAGRDFYLAYAAERIAEGRAFYEFNEMPTVVGAVNQKSMDKASQLLGIVCNAKIIPASGIKEAETSKLFENIQRDVNIAISQEFARFTEAMDMDIFEVVRLANTHSRVNLLIPGAGAGGYCIPNAYRYLAAKAERLGVSLELLKLAREKNELMPEFIVNKTEELLKMSENEIKGRRIAVLGLAMKDYSNDDRMSPAIDICRLLKARGAMVKAFDPVVQGKYDFKSESLEEALEDADAVLILVKQQGIDFYEVEKAVCRNNAVCIDLKEVINEKQVLEHGLRYWRI